MASPPLPLLLYLGATYFPTTRRIHIYMHEKKISPKLVTIVSATINEDAGEVFPSSWDPNFPQMPVTSCPQLAIPKPAAEKDTLNNENYIWVPQSLAIIEYLEDLCDADPTLAEVGSLRGGDDTQKRAFIRGVFHYADSVYDIVGSTVMFGSRPYNKRFMGNEEMMNVPSAQALVKVLGKTTLARIERSLEDATDMEGLEEDREGAPTIGDCALYGTMAFFRDVHGADVAKGYPGLERFMRAFQQRKTGRISEPAGGYHPVAHLPFRDWGIEGEVWPKAVFDH